MGPVGAVRRLVTILLVFGLVGGNKFTDKLDPGTHAELMYVREFSSDYLEASESFDSDWHHSQFGLDNIQFLFFVGVVEVLGGIGLLPGILISYHVKCSNSKGKTATVGLISFVSATGTQYLLQKPMVPALILIFLGLFSSMHSLVP
jgi:hypothetical protein